VIKEADLRWHIKYVNDIESNPKECEYCIIDCGDDTGRMFRVEVMPKADSNGRIKMEEEPYFCFYESSVKKVETENADDCKRCSLYSGYRMINDTLIQVYDSKEDAKKRAYTQYYAIYRYCLDVAGYDIEETTKSHFVI